MTDEDREWLKGTPFSKWLKRLEELEQKLSNHYHGDIGIWFNPEDYKGVKDRIENNEGRISEYYKEQCIRLEKLEKKLEKQEDEIIKLGTCKEDYNEGWDDAIKKYEERIENILNQRIEKLKEQINTIDETLGIRQEILRFDRIEEVLQAFGKCIVWHMEGEHASEYGDLHSEHAITKTIKELLKKLSGEKSVQGEVQYNNLPNTVGKTLEESRNNSTDSTPESKKEYPYEEMAKAYMEEYLEEHPELKSPDEPIAGSARQTEELPKYIPMKSDALEALLHSLPDYFKIDWWFEQIRIFVPTHKLVAKEDLKKWIKDIEEGNPYIAQGEIERYLNGEPKS